MPSRAKGINSRARTPPSASPRRAPAYASNWIPSAPTTGLPIARYVASLAWATSGVSPPPLRDADAAPAVQLQVLG